MKDKMITIKTQFLGQILYQEINGHLFEHYDKKILEKVLLEELTREIKKMGDLIVMKGIIKMTEEQDNHPIPSHDLSGL